MKSLARFFVHNVRDRDLFLVVDDAVAMHGHAIDAAEAIAEAELVECAYATWL